MVKSFVFTEKEVERLKVVQLIDAGFMTASEASGMLGLSIRQVRRLMASYRVLGPVGLGCKHRGKPGTKKLPAGMKENAIRIIKEYYPTFAPAFVCKKLAEEHGIIISRETVRQIMIGAHIWISRKKRPPRIQQPRMRHASIGDLVQIDGSTHDWFEGRGSKCTLLVFVDDASSRLMHLSFVQSESTFSYFNATRQYLEEHGKPLAFYSDKASVFRVNGKKAVRSGMTHYGRAMKELGITHICSHSGAPAKGRVERANRTLQDRLVKELTLRGISSIEEANSFAAEFMRDYNEEFAVVPINRDIDSHRSLGAHEDLDLIFTKRDKRRVSRMLTIQYDNVLYLLEDNESMRRLIRHDIDVYRYPDGRIEARAYGASVPYSALEPRPKAEKFPEVTPHPVSASIEIPGLLHNEPEDKPSGATLIRSIFTHVKAVAHCFY